MADQEVHDRVSSLEHQVQELRDEIARLNKELVEAQLDEWKSRIDELELQAHLGSMNVADQVGPLLETVRNRWLDAQEQLGKAGSSASDVISSLRSGLGQAVDDLRSSIRDARAAIS